MTDHGNGSDAHPTVRVEADFIYDDGTAGAVEQQPVNREHWLQLAIDRMRPIFNSGGYRIPRSVRVSVGWPSSGGLREKSRTEGECWALEAAADKVPQIFITPLIADPLKVLGILAHELGHVVCGSKAGHKAPFVSFCKAVGLEGKPTSALPGDDLNELLKGIIDELGDYPHAALHTEGRRKQGTRLLKVICPECGYTIRVTRKWLEVGTPTCPCSAQMVEPADIDEETGEVIGDVLMPTEHALTFETDDGRFQVRYLKDRSHREHSARERNRWYVTDWQAEAPGPRIEMLPTKHDVLGFIEAVRTGVFEWAPDERADAPLDEGLELDDDELDDELDDDDFIDGDEEHDYPQDDDEPELFEHERERGITPAELGDAYPEPEA